MNLKPLQSKKRYEDIIAAQITVWLWATIFKPCFNIIKSNQVQNSADPLLDALSSGVVWYENECFYAKGKFTNAVAKKLEELGAKWLKSRKAYKLPKDKLPAEILWMIDTQKARAYAKAFEVSQFLNGIIQDFQKYFDNLVFDTAANQILLNLQDRLYKNLKEKKIEPITPKVSDFMKEQIGQVYVNNLKYYIQKRTPEQIIQLRKAVSGMAQQGKSLQVITQHIQKVFGVEQRYARFLARNESELATSAYLQAKYQEEGFTHYKWHTIMDGRERELHKKLNGHVFAFDDPPIIDERTGERGHPGQTYNCRCTFAPVVTKEFLQYRKNSFKAQNSFIDRIKEIWNAKR